MFGLAKEIGAANQLNGQGDLDTIDNRLGTYGFAARWQLYWLLKVPGMGAQTKRRLPLLKVDLDRIKQEVDRCLAQTAQTSIS